VESSSTAALLQQRGSVDSEALQAGQEMPQQPEIPYLLVNKRKHIAYWVKICWQVAWFKLVTSLLANYKLKCSNVISRCSTWCTMVIRLMLTKNVLRTPTNKTVENSRLCPHAQRNICLHSQTPLCTARFMAERCQSVGRRQTWRCRAKVLPLSALPPADWHPSAVSHTPHTTCALLSENTTASTKL